jgi:hypothetical protein
MVSKSEAGVIARIFAPQHDILSVKPFGNGLINSSWVIHCRESKPQKLFLQRMNRHVFNNPEYIIDNLQILHAHIATLDSPKPNTRFLQFPELILTHAETAYHLDDNGEYWRAFRFMENTQTLSSVKTLQQAREIGYVLGRFHSLLSHINLDRLRTTLPDFHVTPKYLRNFDQTYQQSQSTQVSEEMQQCLIYIGRFREYANNLEHAKQAGILPTRLIHGDPKRDNILFDANAEQAISLIDLDTMQPGLIHYDIGDCLRSCCGAVTDGERQNTSMYFDLQLFELILESYLEQTQSFISPIEYDWFYDAILLIPFELGLRFLTDYMDGNIYFKTEYPQQNLHKALQQFTLVADIESKKTHIQATIQRLKQQFNGIKNLHGIT